MNYTHYVGIDVSKDILDVVFLHQGNLSQKKFKNTPKAILTLLSECEQPINSTLFYLDSNGHYSTIALASLFKTKLFGLDSQSD